MPLAPFWELSHPDDSIACSYLLGDVSTAVSYGELRQRATSFEQQLDGGRKLVFLLCSNDINCLVAYLAALRSKHVVALINAQLDPALLQRLIGAYSPDVIAGDVGFPLINYERMECDESIEIRCSVTGSRRVFDEHTAVLLSTSGSTGSAKFARLSYEAIASNAAAISQYLQLSSQERAPTMQPMAYSYGMSVINSHLHVGASVWLTNLSVMEKAFWQQLNELRCTSISGVPYTYQILRRLGFERMELPHLQTMTQAGGRLEEKLVDYFDQVARSQRKAFFVMYGQTEASPRMSYVPPSQLQHKLSSIGIAIPGGSLSLDSQTQEIVYRGPNVMQGYADDARDLALPDQCAGVLRTGDVGELDSDGFMRIVGRTRRFLKLLGNRVSLDEVEAALEGALATAVACTGKDDKMLVAIEADSSVSANATALLNQRYKLHQSVFSLMFCEALPLLSNGKKDYGALLR
jgi:long-chain acyl-CoA synthetase